MVRSIASWPRLLHAALLAAAIALVPGLFLHASPDDLPPGTDPTTVSCSSNQVQIWLWDTYTQLWGRRCIGNGKTVLSSEGDIVAVPIAANVPAPILALIDQSVDVASITAGASIQPQASEVIWGALKKSSVCAAGATTISPLAGCDKGPNAVICLSDGTGCDSPAVPPVTIADAQAADSGGSVGLYSVVADTDPTAGVSNITFTWDVSRWAKGDVFAGLHGGMLKVYDRDFNFKRYIALSDYKRYGTYNATTNEVTLPGPHSNEPTGPNVRVVKQPSAPEWGDPTTDGRYYIGMYVSGCAVEFKTGNVYVTNSDGLDPGASVVGRQPGDVLSAAHGDLPYAELSKRMSTAQRVSGNPTGMWGDLNPESIKFDANRNMYVGHSGPYFNPTGFVTDINGINLFDSAGTTYDATGTTPLEDDQLRRYGSWEMSGRMDPNAAMAPFWEHQEQAWENVENLETGLNLFAWMKNPAGQKIPFRRARGFNLHVYGFNTGTGTWNTTPTIHTPFVSQAGVDWVELTAPDGTSASPTVFYSSEYGDVYRYNPTTGQLSNLNAKRLHPGKIHAMRMLPPGDGTDLVMAASTFGEPGGNVLMRVQVNGGGDATVVQRYLVDEVEDPLSGDMGQPNWYALDISPDGKTMWAFPFFSGDLYQFDIATGQYTTRRIATFNETPFDGQGVCIMWQYNTQQEICDNGVDDDENGLVDENCARIPLNMTVDRPVGFNDSYATREGATLTVPAIGVLVNDGTEFNRHTLTTEIVSGPAHGDLSADTGGLTNGFAFGTQGSFSYKPAAGYHDTDTFTYRVRDPGGRVSDPVTVTITVSPIVADDTYTVSHRGSISVPARQASPAGLFVNDSNDPLTVLRAGSTSSVDLLVGAGVTFTTAGGGQVVMSPTGNFVYTPNAAFVGNDVFYYRATDGTSEAFNTNTGTYGPNATFAKVTIAVTNVNAPVAVNNNYSTPEWVVLAQQPGRTILTNDTDADGDSLHVSQLWVGGNNRSSQIAINEAVSTICLVEGGQLKLWRDGTFEYNPRGSGCSDGVNGHFAVAPVIATFQYAVSDGAADSPLATVYIDVSGNQLPVAYDNLYNTREDLVLPRVVERNLMLNPDSQARTDFDPDTEDVLHVSQWWYNNPADPTGTGWDCAIPANRQVGSLGEPAHCISGPMFTGDAQNDTCLAGGGSVKVWTDGTFIYHPASSGCAPNVVIGPTTQTFWYGVTDDKGGASNLARVVLKISAPLFIPANNKARLYGQANPGFDGAYVLRGQPFTPQPGDLSGTLTCNTVAATGPSTPIGNYPIMCSGQTSELYDLTYQQGMLNIGRAHLTVTADNKTRAYGGANPGFTYQLSGFVNSENATSANVTGAPGLSTSAVATTAVALSPAAIVTTNGSLSAPNYDFTPVNGQLEITRAPLTVTAGNASRVYGAANPAFTFSLSGFANNEDATSAGVTGAPTFSTDADATTAVATSPRLINVATAGTLAAANYSFPTLVAGSLEILRAPLTVKADNKSRPYGSANPTLTYTLSGFANSEDATSAGVTGAPNLSTTAVAATPVATIPAIVVDNAGTLAAANYNFPTLVNGQLTITRVALTVKADNASRLYGAANPTFTYTITGYVNSETASSANVTGAPLLNTTAVATTGVATPAAITVAINTLSAPNYDFTPVNGVLTINRVPLTVTAGNASRVYGAANPAFTFSLSGFANNEDATSAGVTGAPTFSTDAVATTAVATSPRLINVATAGTLAAANYSFPTLVAGSLEILRAPLTVTADNKTRPYGSANPTLTYTLSGFANSEDATSAGVTGAPNLSTAAVAATPVATIPAIVVDNAGTLAAANYNFPTLVNGQLTITRVTLTVKADDASRAYGAANPTFTYTITGYVNSEDASSANVTGAPLLNTTAGLTTAVAASPVTITLAINNLAAPNYSFTPATGNLTITRAPLTVRADDKSRPYASANPALTYTLLGFANSETPASAGVTGSPNLSTTAVLTTGVALSPVAIVVDDAGDLAAANYSFPTLVNGQLTIARVPLTVTPTDASRVYGAANPTFGYTITGYVNGENATSANLTGTPLVSSTAGPTSPVATPVAITAVADTLFAPNYSFVMATGQLTITRAPLTVVADDKNKQYGLANPVFTYSLIGLLNGETAATANVTGNPTYSTTSGTTTPVSESPVLLDLTTAGNLAAPNYFFQTLQDGEITIMPAPLQIKANNASKIFGLVLNFAGTEFTATGLLNNDTVTSVSLTSDGAGILALVGVYDIDPTNAVGTGLANYNITYMPGVLTVLGVNPCPTIATTYTQGGWGAAPSGNNPGALLHSKFTTVYPQGYVQIGGTKWLKFTNPAAVTTYLPSGGTVGVISTSATNPTGSTGAGVFGAQLLALQLNVDFSNAGFTRTGLKDFMMASGPLSGKTVAEVLTIANSVIGGGALPTGVTIADLNTAADTINRNFDNGTTDLGKLIPPCSSCNAGTLITTGSSSTSGTAGNIRTFSNGDVSVKASAWSKTSSGTWNTAYLGAYSLGLGVTDGSEGSGGSNTHVVDNNGRNNYVLFEFSTSVVVNRALLAYLTGDSDASVWIGTTNNPYVNHLTLSDSVLSSLTAETNSYSGSDDDRWADINFGEQSGNVLVISARVGDSNDTFKIGRLELSCAAPTEPENSAPSADADSYTTFKNSPLTVGEPGVLNGDTDPDGDTLQATSVTQPANGAVTLDGDGNFTYTPNTGFVGTDTFTYKAQDAHGELSAPAIVTITVTNRLPTAVANSYTTNKNVPLSIAAPGVLVGDSDPDGDTLTAIIVTGAAFGNVSLSANGAFSYTPSTGYAGTDTFTYKVQDSSGGQSTPATVTITVLQVNSSPTADNDFYTTNKNTPLVIGPYGVLDGDSDPDGDSFFATAQTAAANGTASLGPNGAFIYTPNNNFVGTDTFTYRAQDSNGAQSAAAVVTITVVAPNTPPAATGETYSINKNTPLTVAAPGLLANDSDPDGDTFVAVPVGSPAHGTVSITAAGGFTYTPTNGYTGTDAFTYKVQDSKGAQSGVVSVNITITNRVPTADAENYSTNKNTPLTVAAPGILAGDSDPDGDTLTVVAVTQPSHGSVSVNGSGGFTYTPTNNYSGPDSFTYKAQDTSGAQSPAATVSITVLNTNSAPVAVNDSFTLFKNQPLTIQPSDVLANDSEPDGDVVVPSIVSWPSHGTVTYLSNGNVVYTPDSNYVGTDTASYKLYDGALYSNVATVTFTISHTAPTADPDTYSVKKSKTLNVSSPGVASNDETSGTVTVQLVTGVGTGNGTLTLNANGSFTYVAPGSARTVTFTYRVRDVSGLWSAPATVTINVTN